jgi:predicted anti-sigma-YlaC factor YlaD
MQCSRWGELMSLQLDSLLKPGQVQELQGHLAQCQSCREQWETMSWLSSMLAAEPLATPAPDFASKVTARLEKRAARRQRLYSSIAVCVGSVGLWAAAAVAVLLVSTVLVDPSMRTVLVEVVLSLGRNALSFLTVLGKALWSVVYAVVTRPAGLLVLGYGLVAMALAAFWTRVVLRRWGRVAE